MSEQGEDRPQRGGGAARRVLVPAGLIVVWTETPGAVWAHT